MCACTVGVHTDGSGEGSGQDFRFCIFKVGTSFSFSNLLEVSMVMMTRMIVLQALSITSGTTIQTLCPTGRPVSPCLSLHCRYHYNSDTRCLCVWWPPTFLLTFCHRQVQQILPQPPPDAMGDWWAEEDGVISGGVDRCAHPDDLQSWWWVLEAAAAALVSAGPEPNSSVPGFNFSSSGREDVDVRTLGNGLMSF